MKYMIDTTKVHITVISLKNFEHESWECEVAKWKGKSSFICRQIETHNFFYYIAIDCNIDYIKSAGTQLRAEKGGNLSAI